MRSSLPAFLISTVLTLPVHAVEPVDGMPQLMELNRASQQELQRIQQPPVDPQTGQASAVDPATERLYRQQRLDQQWLQENQRRDLLLRNQRARVTGVPESRRRLDAINQQRQYQREQQNQLDWFRNRAGPLSR